MTRERSFKKLDVLFVKIEAKDKERLSLVARNKGYSNLSEFVRRELLKMADEAQK
jgi:hypothetical protein